ncbi:hypothetical protein D1872_144100 [compost metagenome]
MCNKVFYAEFDGHYLGGLAIVVAKDAETAYAMIKEQCEPQSIGNNLNLSDIKEVKTARKKLIYFQNGDY